MIRGEEEYTLTIITFYIVYIFDRISGFVIQEND